MGINAGFVQLLGIIVGFVTASKPATAPTLNKAADDRATQQAYDDYHRDLLSAAALPSKEVKAASKVLDLAKKEVKQEAKEGASKVVKEAAKGGSNFAKNAKKMSLDDIGDFLGAGKDWHKGSAKIDFLKQFKKELKGDTNADFYFDETTREVFLKSNKSGIWINTGQKF